MAFGSGGGAPKINAHAMPRNVSATPKFPRGARPMNVTGPRINEHPSLPDGSSSTKARVYNKPQGGGFNPFGGI